MVRLLTVLTCVAACGGLCAGERSTPRFQGDSLPVPPQQSAPWTPPKTRLSSRLIAATRTLFAQGLADPRGCAYREIETGEGEGRYDVDERGVFKSHGWVLPADAARPERFAVRWDGLVYQVLTIGPAANLGADVAETIEAKGQGFEERDGYLIRLCLLLRLGESRLAEAYFDYLIAEDEDLWDPYLILAEEWTWSLFTRAAHAHMRGDDRLSLLTARALIPIWEAVEAEATELDLPRPEAKALDDNSAGEIARYLEELKPIRVILADQERRAVERALKKGAPLCLDDLDYSLIESPKDFWDQVEARLGRHLDKGQRIALVTDWFEETSRPAAWRLANYLRPYRDQAVEPLLNCLENDTRLSRGGEFAQDGFKPEGVDQVAYDVLCGILETHFDAYFGVELTRQDRRALVERIRAHWHKIRNMSPADGWYEILRDDSESPDRWVEAVNKTIAYGGPTVNEIKERSARRETLRKKRDPSMTELLVKRARSLAEQGSMPQATLLALALADWDPGAALPILRNQTTRWCAVLRDQDLQKHYRRWIPSEMVQLTLARAKLKDASALPEYLQILREMSPPEEPPWGEYVFQPLVQYPDAPEVVAAAQWMFNDAASPWNATTHLMRLFPGRNELMILPAFRKLVLRTLADTQTVGAAEVKSYDDICIAAIGYNTQTFAGDPLCPAPGTSVAVRRCDVCAWGLAEIYGMPRCELYWPKARRDQAVAQCSRRLQQYGRLLAKPGPFTGNPGAVGFVFPSLDHPATPEDVRNGQAIFSLEGQATVRCCKLLAKPARARWVTFREEPFLAWDYDAEKEISVPRVEYRQEGVVWQAEEVEVGGKWRRYYGFAGAGRMAQVRAEELEFDVPGERWDDAFNVELEFWMPRLNLANRSGLPQPVPRFHSADDPTPAAPSSTVLNFHLHRFVGSDDEPPWDASPNFSDHTRGEDRQWREIPRNPTARLRIEQLPAQLQPMEAIPLFTVNLDVDYPKLAPGYYRAAASLTATGDGPKRVLRLLRPGPTHIRSDSRDP